MGFYFYKNENRQESLGRVTTVCSPIKEVLVPDWLPGVSILLRMVLSVKGLVSPKTKPVITLYLVILRGARKSRGVYRFER